MKIAARLREIIEAETPATRRFISLEEWTDIKAETWRTWWNRGGRASEDMIQAAAQTWPEYAFWLVTGVTDFEHGHVHPHRNETRHNYSWLTPIYADEKLARAARQRVRSAAKDYFRKKIEYARWILQVQNQIEERDEDDIWLKDNAFEDEFVALSRIRAEQEETLSRIEREAGQAAEKEHAKWIRHSAESADEIMAKLEGIEKEFSKQVKSESKTGRKTSQKKKISS